MVLFFSTPFVFSFFCLKRTMKIAQVSLHACVGVVLNPSKGVLFGTQPFWSCQLLTTQVGKSAWAHSELLLSSEMFLLRCRGLNVVEYCASTLQHGDVVHTLAKLLHKPRYSSEHSMYFNETELLITDSFGKISLVKRIE